ncbi:MAG: RHS repeat-associated core domain-containing protein [Candidatus Acidiferrales bacterium]
MEIKSVGEVVATRALLLMGDNSGKEILVQIGKPCPFPDGFSYDALSRRTQMARPNGVATNYSYDTLSRLLSVLHQAGGSTIDGASYTLDAAGNRTSNTNWLAGAMTSYGYDSVYELLQATQGANMRESYSYDPVGNRLSSLAASYTVNSSNEMTASGGVMYTYDANGNTTSKINSTGTISYAWDFENRLTQVTLPGSGGTVTFKYDPFGKRIEKISPTTTSIFVYDRDNLAETVNSSGGAVARYTQAQNVDEPLAMQHGATIDYYEADGLGSITSLTNSAGAVADTYTHDSFGKSTATTGTLVNPFQYTAREFDTDTNLYFYRARYYDPTTGRFLSEDPLMFNSGQINFYDYVGNSPVTRIDPMGLAFCILIMDSKTQGAGMLCIPSDPRDSPVAFPVASGNNGEETRCKNNPACAANEGQGPIPLGLWQFTNAPNSKGDKGGRTLEPVPGTGTNDAEGRTGILTHWCLNPFGPSAGPPYCSEGCVTATQEDINALNNLIDAEPNSLVLVLGK